MALETKQQILDLLRKHQSELQSFGVKRCGLFGSFVRMEQQAGSDVDILVEFDPQRKSFDNFMNLAFFLDQLLGMKVDLVTTESLSPYIGPRILHEVEYASGGT